MKKKYWILTGLFTIMSRILLAQVGIGTTSVAGSAMLEIKSTNKGMLMPRMSGTQMRAISNPVLGLQVYNTDSKCVYYYNGSEWLSAVNALRIFADRGDELEFDNLRIQIPSSGNRSLQLRTLVGSISIEGTSINKFVTTAPSTGAGAASITSYIKQSVTLSTSYQYWQSTLDFNHYGSSQEIYFSDDTNNRAYRIYFLVGYLYNDCFFEIERVDTN
jgi:hypothetical protein